MRGVLFFMMLDERMNTFMDRARNCCWMQEDEALSSFFAGACSRWPSCRMAAHSESHANLSNTTQRCR